VVAQFADDFFSGNPDERVALLRIEMAPHVGALLLIDRPPGFTGHGGGNTAVFAYKFGKCILAFITAGTASPPC
jgi:hypothetical protein